MSFIMDDVLSEYKPIPVAGYTREQSDMAIAILRRIVEIDPLIFIDKNCFLCMCEFDTEHFDDCPYILAKQLLAEIDNGRT